MVLCVVVFFFKQKTAYEIGTGDWSSDVCSSDLLSKHGPYMVYTLSVHCMYIVYTLSIVRLL